MNIIFLVFNLTRPGTEPEFTFSIAERSVRSTTDRTRQRLVGRWYGTLDSNHLFYIAVAQPLKVGFSFRGTTKERSDAEIKAGIRMQEIIDDTLSMARNELEAQRMATEYGYRKRLHEQERAKGELEWQQFKVRFFDIISKNVHVLTA